MKALVYEKLVTFGIGGKEKVKESSEGRDGPCSPQGSFGGKEKETLSVTGGMKRLSDQ